MTLKHLSDAIESLERAHEEAEGIGTSLMIEELLAEARELQQRTENIHDNGHDES